MYPHLVVVLGCVGLVSAITAEAQQRRATLTANTDDNVGKCTIEVVVDGSAEIEIRGDSALMRNRSGQRPQWRRFECTGSLPTNPVNFRFSGVDGRGHQQMIRDPRSGGTVVVRIDDPKGGSEGYTFDITWDPTSSDRYTASANDRSTGRQRDQLNGRGNRNSRFAIDNAVRACQEAVRQQAGRRFNGAELAFQTARLDDQTGQRITGTFDVRGRRQNESYRFSCSANPDGQIQSAEIESMHDGYNAPPSVNDIRTSSPRQVQMCERAVSDRLQRDRYSNIDIQSLHADTGQGRSDSITGTVRANRGDRSDFFDFSCSLDRDKSALRSIDLKRR